MTVSKSPDLGLKMKIKKVDGFGIVNVRFSKDLVVVQNISLIDSSVLIINVTSFYQNEDSARNLNFTWDTI